MSKLKFTPEDFGKHIGTITGWTTLGADAASNVANAKFDEWLSKQVKMRGAVFSGVYHMFSASKFHDTHEGFLVCIEKIDKDLDK